ncbi:MAG TPA: hypothetical protein VKC53_02630 [Patescibacteria group bacterium]|nr:hypothetical protein [Patescibacteria group bacterium]
MAKGEFINVNKVGPGDTLQIRTFGQKPKLLEVLKVEAYGVKKPRDPLASTLIQVFLPKEGVYGKILRPNKSKISRISTVDSDGNIKYP